MWQAGTRYTAASVAVGAGASAVATILFTDALFHSDFITPVVLQKRGIYAYNAQLRWSQWLGVALIITVVSLLPAQRRRRMVRLPAPAPSPA